MLTYGQITGRFLVSVGDGADADTQPDLIPAKGTIRLIAAPDALLDPDAPSTVFPRVLEFALDGTGALPAGSMVPATDNTQINPVGWTYRVQFNLQRSDTGERLRYDSFAFQVPAGQTVDLTLVAPVSDTGGVLTVRGATGISLGVITTADDMDAITTPGVYVMRVDWAQTGAARFPAHVPEQFYATDGTKLAPTIEPLVFVYTDSRGEVAQQILADAASTTTFSRSVWYRESEAGSLAGVFFNLDANLQQTLPTFTSSITQGGPLNGFGQNWPDGQLVLMSGASIDMAAFTTALSWTWMNTIVNLGNAAVPVTSSGGTPLKTPSGHTPSILPGGTATIIGVANFSGDAYWFLSGDLA